MQVEVGDKKLQKCGLEAIVIKLLPNGKCRVFLGYRLVKDVSILSFLNGEVGSVNDSLKPEITVGSIKKQYNSGLNAKILSISEDKLKITVEFENGIVRQDVSIYDFYRGRLSLGLKKKGKRVSHSVGDKVLQNCGSYAEIIILDTEKLKCSVRFDNGVVKENVSYDRLKRGLISDKAFIRFKIGLKVKQNCGLYAEVIDIEDTLKCTVRFENGAIRRNIYKSAFLNGQVSDTQSKTLSCSLGTRIIAKNGIGLEIVNYNNASNITVKSDDGKVSKTTVKKFRGGAPSLTNAYSCKEDKIVVNDLIGKKIMQKCGFYAECVSRASKQCVIVRFESGLEKSVSYRNFFQGNIGLNKYELMFKNVRYNKLGLKYTILNTDKENLNNMFVVFDDGVITSVTRASVLKEDPMPKGIVKDGHNYIVKSNNSLLRSIYFDSTINKFRVVVEDKSNHRRICILD